MPHLEHNKLLSPKARLSHGRLAVYGGLAALVGIVVVVVIFAATGSLAFEAEDGTLAGSAAVASVSGASGGKAVQFGAAATSTPTPPPTGVLSNPGNGISTDPNFFPITVWEQTPESHATDYKNIGVNVFNDLYNGITQSALSAIGNAGMGLFQDGQSSLGLGSSVVKAWEQDDEPDNAQSDGSGGYGPCIDPSVIVNQYNQYKAGDSQKRPVYINFGRGAAQTNWNGRGSCTNNTAQYAQYAKGADILSFDIYPVNNGLALNYVAKGVDNMRQWSGYTKPVYAYVETTNYGNTQGPTPVQTKAEVWMALTHGANGINYFVHILSPTFNEPGLLASSTMTAAVKAIDGQIAALAPVLNQPSVATQVATGASSQVDSIVKSYNGATYVFAVETGGKATSATVKVPGLSSGTATVIDENRTISVSGGQFTDSFTAYGVHLYKIQ